MILHFHHHIIFSHEQRIKFKEYEKEKKKGRLSSSLLDDRVHSRALSEKIKLNHFPRDGQRKKNKQANFNQVFHIAYVIDGERVKKFTFNQLWNSEQDTQNEPISLIYHALSRSKFTLRRLFCV